MSVGGGGRCPDGVGGRNVVVVVGEKVDFMLGDEVELGGAIQDVVVGGGAAGVAGFAFTTAEYRAHRCRG